MNALHLPHPSHRTKRNSMIAMGLVAILVISLLTFGWAAFISNKATNSLGRELRVNGDFKVDWDWTAPRIYAEKITLANTPGAKDPYMLQVDKAEFRIKIWKLLIGRLEIPEVNIVKPVVILEKKEDGSKNWELPAFSKGNAAVETVAPDSRRNFPLIDNLTITDAQLVYRDDIKDLEVDLKLNKAAGQDSDKAEQFTVNGEGTMQGEKFSLDAVAGSLSALRNSNKDFPLNFTIKMGATEISVDGTFKDPVKMTGVNANLHLSGNDMADLFYFLSLPLPHTPPYDLKADLKKEGDIWSSDQLVGKVGGSDLSGRFSYDTTNERPFFKADLNSKLLDADDLGGFIGLAPSSDKGTAQDKKNNASSKIIPNVDINLARLRSADMDVTLDAEKLDAPGIPFKGMNVRFDLQQGVLKLNPLKFSLADGVGAGTVILDGSKDIPDVSINMNLSKLRLKSFFENSRFEDLSAGSIGASIDLSGSGKSLADVLANSNGRIVALMSGGKISLLLMEASNLDLAEATPLFLGEDKSTEIRCGVADFKVKNGLLVSNIFVLDTTDTNLQGDAKINLKNESLDIRLDAQPKDPSILSLQGPIVIGGQMKDPSIGVPVETGARGAVAAVLGTLLTPIAAVIPFIETGSGEDSNCNALVAHARKAGAPSTPSNSAKTSQ